MDAMEKRLFMSEFNTQLPRLRRTVVVEGTGDLEAEAELAFALSTSLP